MNNRSLIWICRSVLLYCIVCANFLPPFTSGFVATQSFAKQQPFVRSISHRRVSNNRQDQLTHCYIVDNSQNMSSLGKHKLTDEDPAIATTRKEPFYVDDSSTISLEHYLIPKHYEGTLDSLLIPYGTIISRIEKVAHDIIKDYEGKTIHLLCVLKGGETFFHDLCNALRRYYSHRDHGPIIPFVFDFIRVSSYNGTESTGDVQISGCDVSTLANKHVLFVEDIIDTGLTMTKLIAKLLDDAEHAPASVQVTALAEKRTPLSCGFKARYVAFSIPDKFVVGYGMDYNEVYRDLGHIAVINAAGIEKYKN